MRPGFLSSSLRLSMAAAAAALLLACAPPVAAAETDLESSVARMAKIGGCWSPSLSPDGERLAFVSDLNGVPQVWMVETAGGFPRLVTALDDQVGSVSWSPDGRGWSSRWRPAAA